MVLVYLQAGPIGKSPPVGGQENFPICTEYPFYNQGARYLANAQQPTRNTRHIDIKQLVILQWTDQEQIIFSDIPTTYNISDLLSKQTGRIKFHEHRDIIMGHTPPTYTVHHNGSTPRIPTNVRILAVWGGEGDVLE